MEDAERVRAGEQLVAAAHKEGIRLALLGGVAIRVLCPSARDGGPWQRSLADIDLATVPGERKATERLLREKGLEPEAHFNLMNGSERLRYLDEDGAHVDVFLGEMRLCHVIEWRKALGHEMTTLPVPELLLTKLQIVKIEEKDLGDLSALLQDQWPAVEADRKRLTRLVGQDWGLWKTSLLNLEILGRSDVALVASRAGDLAESWRSGPRSLKYRARAIVGERVRWYEEPEEV